MNKSGPMVLARAFAIALKRPAMRRIAQSLFGTTIDVASPEFISQLGRQFCDRHPELLSQCVVSARPDLVEQELIKSVPRIALRQECYSQEGEDLIIARMFSKADGFYVDVGAHHPIRFSNTYLLYRRGWRGINIDAAPGSMNEFRRLRPDDINLECLISDNAEARRFYLFNEPALNTGEPALAKERDEQQSQYNVIGTTILKPRTLASILKEHLPPGRRIDLLNVDVEGLDLDVLRSNDWHRFRPTVILAELLSDTQATRTGGAAGEFLESMGYRMTSRFYNTALFQMTV
jgi:FkbM family methyltransferase